MKLANQAYLSIIPLGVGSYLALNSFRNQEPISNYYTWRSKDIPSDFIVDKLDVEFTNVATEKKRAFRNSKLQISMIDNLEPRTYGSFTFSTGAEFQIPVIHSIQTVDELREKHPNLLSLVKELKVKGVVDASEIDDYRLGLALMSDAAHVFSIKRELTQAQSVSHIVVPCAVGSASIIVGYPIFSALSATLGGWMAFAVVGVAMCYFTYQVLAVEAKQRVVAMDRRVLESDPTLIRGAKDYFRSRQALGKLFYEFGNNSAKKVFDEEGNCTKQFANYTNRLRLVKDFEVELRQSQVKNTVRAL